MNAFRRAHLWLGPIIIILLFVNTVACGYSAPANMQWSLLLPLTIAIMARVFTGRTIARAEAAAMTEVFAADEVVESDPEKAMELTRHALTSGAAGGVRVLGWLVAARVHERIGDFAKADEAIDLAVKRSESMTLDAPLLLRLRLQMAFVKAAVGDVNTASKTLAAVQRHELADPLSTADYARARALIAYRKGEHAEVIDIVAQELAEGAVDRTRDVALLEQLRASSRLRIEGGGPMRVAVDPGATEGALPRDEEWVHALVAEPADKKAAATSS